MVFFVLVFVVVLVFAVCAVVFVATDAALVVYTFLAGVVSRLSYSVACWVLALINPVVVRFGCSYGFVPVRWLRCSLRSDAEIGT